LFYKTNHINQLQTAVYIDLMREVKVNKKFTQG